MNRAIVEHESRSGPLCLAYQTGRHDATGLGDPGPLPQPAASFRRAVDVSKQVRSARLYVTALGSYRVYLNGTRVSSDVLTPEFTDYRKRVLYQTYDVTNRVKPGDNAVGAIDHPIRHPVMANDFATPSTTTRRSRFGAIDNREVALPLYETSR